VTDQAFLCCGFKGLRDCLGKAFSLLSFSQVMKFAIFVLLPSIASSRRILAAALLGHATRKAEAIW